MKISLKFGLIIRDDKPNEDTTASKNMHDIVLMCLVDSPSPHLLLLFTSLHLCLLQRIWRTDYSAQY